MVAAGAVHRARGVRPELGQAAQQRGLSGARLPGDDQRLARIQPQVQVADQLLAVRVADLDGVELDRTVASVSTATFGNARLCSLAVTSPCKRRMEAR